MSDSALSGNVSSRPFFLWAMVEYLRQDNLTPLIVVDGHYPGTSVPDDFVDEQTGQVTLSLGKLATRDLAASYDKISFDAAFPGQVIYRIEIPTLAVLAVLCQEDASLNMVMSEEERTHGFIDDPTNRPNTPLGFAPKQKEPAKTTKSTKKKRPSHLRLVKDDEA